MPVLSPNPFFFSVDEIWVGRDGTPFNAGGDRTITRKFRVVVLLKELDAVAVCQCPGLPVPFQTYSTATGGVVDTAARLTRLSASQEYQDDWQNWIVTAEYGTRMPRGGPAPSPGYASSPTGSENNPEQEMPDIRYGGNEFTYAAAKDLDDKPYWNSAKQPLTPAPHRRLGNALLTVSYNALSFSRAEATKWAFTVNSDVFLGTVPEQCLCYPIDAQLVFRGQLRFYRVTVKIEFKSEKPDGTADSWNAGQYLDAGYDRIVPATETDAEGNVFANVNVGKHERIKDVMGRPVTHPVPLNGVGDRLTPVTAAPVYLTFRDFRAKPFITLFPTYIYNLLN